MRWTMARAKVLSPAPRNAPVSQNRVYRKKIQVNEAISMCQLEVSNCQPRRCQPCCCLNPGRDFEVMHFYCMSNLLWQPGQINTES